MEKLSFNEQLVILRKRKALTQEALAEKAGILREMISNYESGKTVPREPTLRKIAEILEADFESLYNLAIEEKGKAKENVQVLFNQEENKLKERETISDVVTLPVLNKVYEGDVALIPDNEIIDLIKLSRKIARTADYALEISELSTDEMCVNIGDIALVRARQSANDNDTVIVKIEENYYVKRFKKNEQGEFWIEPENNDDQSIKNKAFKIVGIITYLIKKL